MENTFIVANWKSHKSEEEIQNWFVGLKIDFAKENRKTIIVCPPYVYLPLVRQIIDDSGVPIKVGAQDVSIFDAGAHTGEVNAQQIKDFAEYVILGHSERRKNGETEEQIENKLKEAIKAGIVPILCVQGVSTPIYKETKIIAFEPPSSISTSGPDAKADDLEAIEKVYNFFKMKQDINFLYGGSVKPSNVAAFTRSGFIDGVLVGDASLDPVSFSEIVENA